MRYVLIYCRDSILISISFVMPAIYDSLVRSQGLTPHKAWRVAYVIPFIIIVFLALCMLFTCEDTPTGKWSERHIWMKENNEANIIDITSGNPSSRPSGAASVSQVVADVEKKDLEAPVTTDHEAQMTAGQVGTVFKTDTPAPASPSFNDALRIIFSPSTMAVAIPYACSFGSELSINSILGNYYAKNFPGMGQTRTGQWAAMFGLLNIVCRPAGGFLADVVYRYTDSVWSKKILLLFLAIVMGAFQLAIGLSDPKNQSTMFGLTAGLAFFLEACNGANFALVPHVHPFANGKTPDTTLRIHNRK